MRIHPVVLWVTVAGMFVAGILVGLGMSGNRKPDGRIDLNPFPESCTYNGRTYKSGAGFPADDGCNTCGCEDGEVLCTLMACGPDVIPLE